MSSIFLSHNSQDNRFAGRLGTALSDYGVKVWIDEAEIKVGDSLLEKISEGISDMEYLGVILSPQSVNSAWVQKELQMAMTREIKNRKVQVLPILFKSCEIPLFLQDKVYADFRNRSMFQSSLIKLLDTLLPHGFQEHILKSVRNAIDAEFNAYRRLPEVDLTDIDKLFTKDGSARKRIVRLLKERSAKGWGLDNPSNPSTAELLDIKLDKVLDDKAYVSTEEYWYLRWCDNRAGKYSYIYNKKNRQKYVLEKDRAGQWKVDINQYPGVSGPTYPEYKRKKKE